MRSKNELIRSEVLAVLGYAVEKDRTSGTVEVPATSTKRRNA
jgi:hypothetical protein